MKRIAVSTITKSLPIVLPVLVNHYLLAAFGNTNLFFINHIYLQQRYWPYQPKNRASLQKEKQIRLLGLTL
ncbi:hypothetical protein AM493_06560 [Flavobacterium akiainvivens]|uniref:Uncharacterized protein n=1 Tax=Flavobacterium akiainvivens TaxID=1202724 RepID=A0A0M8MH85_9FLAO|nr:hypothetical protein AM493_06560 [Flavobacterium akiainvivens]